MKAYVIALLLALPVAANAQVKVLSGAAPKVELAGIVRDASDTFHSKANVYYDAGIIYLSVQTTNQFDSRFTFKLGTTKEEAVASLRDLAELCGGEVGTRYELDRWDGQTCSCIVADEGRRTIPKSEKSTKGTRVLMSADGYAGAADMSRKNFDRLARLVENYKGEL